MTVKEYFTRKNEILQRHFGTDKVLVTVEDAAEVPQYHLDARKDILSCPYCLIYLASNCEGCPSVVNKGDYCKSEDSSYNTMKAVLGVGKLSESPAGPELEALIQEYNDDLDNGIDNGIPLP